MAAYAVRDQGLAMRGFTELQRALTRIGSKSEFGLEYELARRLRGIGERVAETAPLYVQHKTGRDAVSPNPRLEESVKVSVTLRSASVYSTAAHGGAQNVGGQVGRNRATLLKRAEVSQWMIRAVSSTSPWVAEQMDGLLDWLVAEFEAA